MAQFQIKQATRHLIKLRMALMGVSGSGKTRTAIGLALDLGRKVVVIDTENRSAERYADSFEPLTWDHLPLDRFEPDTYSAAIRYCEEQGYDVIVVDSLSHAWMGKGGALEQVDAAAKRNQNNSFAGWREVTPKHNAMVESLIHCKAHLIVTMRSKSEYVIDETEGQGGRKKMAPRKVGMAPIQRDGLEYEFDIVGDMDLDHNLIITKTRCEALDRGVFPNPGPELAHTIRGWIAKGTLEQAETETAIDRIPSTVGGKPVTDRHRMGAPKVEPPAEAHGAYLQALAKQHGWTGKTVKPMRESYGFDSLDAVDIDHADEIAAILTAGPQAWDDARYLEEHPPEPNEADWLTAAADVGWTPAAALRLIRGWTGTPEAMGAAIDAGPAAGEGSR